MTDAKTQASSDCPKENEKNNANDDKVLAVKRKVAYVRGINIATIGLAALSLFAIVTIYLLSMFLLDLFSSLQVSPETVASWGYSTIAVLGKGGLTAIFCLSMAFLIFDFIAAVMTLHYVANREKSYLTLRWQMAACICSLFTLSVLSLMLYAIGFIQSCGIERLGKELDAKEEQPLS